MRKKVTVVGSGFVGSTTAQRIVDADLADVVSGPVEFEQPRPLASRVDEDVPFGIGGDADAFPKVEVGWKLQQVGDRLEGDGGR